MTDHTALSTTPPDHICRALAGMFVDPHDDDIAARVAELIGEAQGVVAILEDVIDAQREHRGDIDCNHVISLLHGLDRTMGAARLLAAHIRNQGGEA